MLSMKKGRKTKNKRAAQAGMTKAKAAEKTQAAKKAAPQTNRPSALPQSAAEGEPSKPDPQSKRIPAPPATNEHVRKSMQGNKRANTKPELIMREKLREAGLGGYRLQWKVPGHPDIAWPGKHVALFINGCFWHRCPHCNPSTPKSHVEYWAVKFNRNVERDAENLAALKEAGWTVHTVWECQLKKKAIEETLADLFPKLADELGKQLKKPPSEEQSEQAEQSDKSKAAREES